MMQPKDKMQFWPDKRIANYAANRQISQKEAIGELLKNNIYPERFKRNQGLISPDAQLKLLNLKIFIAGCGGLGGEMAAHLVQLGAGQLFLCDYDEYEESNLNRQRFCDSNKIGKSKAQITADSLRQKAPWGEYQPVEIKLAAEAKPAIFDASDIVIDCLDSVSGKKMFEGMAAAASITWLHGSVLGHEGFACLAHRPKGILKKLYGQACKESGAGSVLSHVVSGVASMMTSLFLKWLVNPDYDSPLMHCDFSVPEMEAFPLP